MKLLHTPANGSKRTLATNIDTADSLFTQARGLMFRRSIPDDYALVFRFDSVDDRDVHMLFVPFPIDVVWTIEGEVQRVEQLRPWLGLAKAQGDQIIELPAGAADNVKPGDRLEVRG